MYPDEFDEVVAWGATVVTAGKSAGLGAHPPCPNEQSVKQPDKMKASLFIRWPVCDDHLYSVIRRRPK
jgi:hypothetical protein